MREENGKVSIGGRARDKKGKSGETEREALPKQKLTTPLPMTTVSQMSSHGRSPV